MDRKTTARLLRTHSRLVWAITVASIVFFIARVIYFDINPLFGYIFLAESIFAAIFFLLVYFLGTYIVKFIGSWLENLIQNIFRKVLYEFWKIQSQRFIEAIKREEKEVENGEYFSNIPAAVLDTSVLIDGRILGVIQTGFISGKILIPQGVVDELQHLADKKASIKRQKGRRGLDVLRDIKKIVGKKRFSILESKEKVEDVDKSLVEFCKKNKTTLVTVDYNLNKAAQVVGVEVLNINKLANEVKTNLIPGEILLIKLVQQGKEPGQAVGYLEDGTMIVVKDAGKFIGDHKDVVIDKVLQTSAGKMLFASLANSK